MDFEEFNFDDILGDFAGSTGSGSDSSSGSAGEPETDFAVPSHFASKADSLPSEDTDTRGTVSSADDALAAFSEEEMPPRSRSRRERSSERSTGENERRTARRSLREDQEESQSGRKASHSDTGKSSESSQKMRDPDAAQNSRRTHDAGKLSREASRKAREEEREARESERKEEHRRRILEKKADQQLIERQRRAAEREREESREFLQQQKIDERKKDVEGRRKSNIGLVVFIVVTVILVAGFLFAAKTINNSLTSMPNLYAGTISIGGMTEFEVSTELSMNGWDNRVNTPLTVTLPANVSFTVDPVSAGVVLPSDQIKEKAMAYGRTGNMFTTMFCFIESLFKPLDINDASTNLNTEYIQQQIDAAQQLLTEAVGTEPYTLDYEAGQIRTVKGAGMLEVESVGLMSSIVSSLKAGSSVLDYRIVKQEPDMPDFQAIHDSIAAEVVDAKYSDDGKFNVIDETVGCDFDVNEAITIWNNTADGETAVIPMKVTLPAVTGEELRSRLFNDVLGEMTTYFPNSTDERVSNVALCASKVNGTVLYNGDVFSYNATVGERTEEAGFQKAPAYSSGEVVEELGGGACQVSSTIYCATLYACMETVERTCHQFEVAYMDQLGLDATVSWPEPDFKFRNNKIYPVRIDIECDTEARSLHVRLMGTKENDYTVELKTDKYQYVNENGNWVGWRTLTYRILYDSDGNVVQVPDQYGNMVDYEYTNQIIEATGKPGMDTYMFHDS